MGPETHIYGDLELRAYLDFKRQCKIQKNKLDNTAFG